MHIFYFVRVMSSNTHRLRGSTVSSRTSRPNMTISSDPDSETGRRERFRIGSSGTPVRWNGDNWTFYKHAMINAFEESFLDQISIGKETPDDSWDDDEKGESKKKQAKINILIQGSLLMKLARQVMMKKTGTQMCSELVLIYEGKTNPAVTAQKVYHLHCDLHRTHLRGKGNVRSHLHKLFDIRNQLVDLGSPVNDLQMVRSDVAKSSSTNVL